MKVVAGVMGLVFSFAAIVAPSQGGRIESFPSRLLDRDVPLALHVPGAAPLQAWRARHPGFRPRLVLFLPGAWDGPKDLLRTGLFADLDRREASGELPPALWVAPAHYRSWYADRKDGRFPYERFLMEELLPDLERRFPDFGGSPETRTVAGLSMGGFGALNLSGRTKAFSRCAALSPALVEAPFSSAGWWLRRSLTRAFPTDPEAFAPWNPWRHLGGDAQLVVGCGAQDEHGLAEVVRGFQKLCGERGRQLSVYIGPGKHDWNYWTPAFEELALWINGGALPQDRSNEARP